MKMPEDELINALKQKSLASFGTKTEKQDRLLKHYSITLPSTPKNQSMWKI